MITGIGAAVTGNEFTDLLQRAFASLDRPRDRTAASPTRACSRRRVRTRRSAWRGCGRAHLGLALACTASGRLDEAEREALIGERLRRSRQPTVGQAHAVLVLANVRVARSRLERAASDLK